MKGTKYIMFILLGTLFYSCEKDIEYKGEKLKNFMVLNAILSNDSLIEVELTRSNTIFEQQAIQPIRKAQVYLYLNGEKIAQLKEDNDGQYKSARKAVIGQKYEITAEATGYDKLKTSVEIPQKSSFYLASLTPQIEYHNGFNCLQQLKVKLAIEDEPGEDYYQLNIKKWNCNVFKSQRNGKDTTFLECTFGEAWLNSDDPVLHGNKAPTNNNEFEEAPENLLQIFDDALFDGETYELELQDYIGICLEPSDTTAIDIEYLVDIRKISKDLYLYYKSRSASEYYRDNPLSEPVRIMSNVEGGAGIVGTATSNSRYIHEKIYINQALR